MGTFVDIPELPPVVAIDYAISKCIHDYEEEGVTSLFIRSDATGMPFMYMGTCNSPRSMTILMDWAKQRMAQESAPEMH